MKKLFLLLILGQFVVINSYCQSDSLLVNKKGKPILPKKGDFAIGISANPFFSYTGNMFSSSGNNSLDMNLLNNSLLYGKYFMSSQRAIRLKFSLHKNSNTLTSSVIDDNNALNNVEDKLTTTNTSLQIIPGIEQRSGKSRLQIFYGGELIFTYSKSIEKYSYGNGFSTTNPEPTSTFDFNNQNSSRVISRPTENVFDKSYSFGIRGFAGLEYFILPKISIGCEMGLNFILRNTGDQELKNEYWDFVNNNVVTKTNKTTGVNNYNFNTDILNGQLLLIFYLN
jgi:hypothetical protein